MNPTVNAIPDKLTRHWLVTEKLLPGLRLHPAVRPRQFFRCNSLVTRRKRWTEDRPPT